MVLRGTEFGVVEERLKKQLMKEKVFIFAKIFVIILPIVYGVFIVTHYGINVFYMDEWNYAYNMNRFWTWDYLWAPHNEHRMIFPKVVTGIVGILTSWNSKAFMYVSQICLILYYIIVTRILLCGKTLRELDWINAIEVFSLGICIYNLAQWENLLWGFQIAWFMIASLSVVSYYLLDKYLEKKKVVFFVLSMIIAVIVSFCSMHGLMIWSGYLFFIFICYIKKKTIPKEIKMVIPLMTIICYVLYFYHFSFPKGHQVLYAKNFGSFIEYFFTSIGVFIWTAGISELNRLWGMMIIVLTFLFLFLWNQKNDIIMVNYGPIIMGGCAIGLIAIGRGGNSLDVASRYMTVSGTVVIFFLLLCFKLINRMRDQNIECWSRNLFENRTKNLFVNVVIICAVIIPVLVVVRNADAVEDVEKITINRRVAQMVALNYKTATVEEIRMLFPFTDETSGRNTIEDIEKNNQNVFGKYKEHDDALETLGYHKIANEPQFCIDQINGKNVIENVFQLDGQNLSISGWIEVEKIEDKRCYLKIGSDLYLLNWADRPDVKDYFGNDSFSGFVGELIINNYENKNSEMSLVIIDYANQTYDEIRFGN